MSEKMFEIDFLTDKDNYYLASNNKKVLGKTDYEFDLSDIALYRMEEVSFEDQAPRKEALENVLSTMKIDGVNSFICLWEMKMGLIFIMEYQEILHLIKNRNFLLWI